MWTQSDWKDEDDDDGEDESTNADKEGEDDKYDILHNICTVYVLWYQMKAISIDTLFSWYK